MSLIIRQPFAMVMQPISAVESGYTPPVPAETADWPPA